jgi:hypothetical protein
MNPPRFPRHGAETPQGFYARIVQFACEQAAASQGTDLSERLGPRSSPIPAATEGTADLARHSARSAKWFNDADKVEAGHNTGFATGRASLLFPEICEAITGYRRRPCRSVI